LEWVDALLGDGAQVRPVIAHVKGVEQLLAGVQAAEPSMSATPERILILAIGAKPDTYDDAAARR